MSKFQASLASIIIVNWNGKELLEDCLSSLAHQTYPHYEVILVDNASTDDSVEFVKKHFPQVKVVQNEKNLGYAKGCNVGAEVSHGKHLIFLNSDTRAEPNWLEELVKGAENNGKVAACMPKILLSDQPGTINSSGIMVHYLGFAWAGNYGVKDEGQFKEGEVPSASGTAMLVKRKALQEVGLFDGDYFMYQEDVDLSWRLRLAGYKILYRPSAIIYHKYTFSKGEQKFYYLEKNRLSMLLTHYKMKTLFLIWPMISLMEAWLLFYFLFTGGIRNIKLKGYWNTLKNYSAILQKRRKIQTLRRTRDKEIIRLFTPIIDFREINNPFLNYFANPLLAAYWKVVKRFV